MSKVVDISKLAQSRATTLVPASPDRAVRKKLENLMVRDGLDWRTFLARAVVGYELMYSRTE